MTDLLIEDLIENLDKERYFAIMDKDDNNTAIVIRLEGFQVFIITAQYGKIEVTE